MTIIICTHSYPFVPDDLIATRASHEIQVHDIGDVHDGLVTPVAEFAVH